MESISVVVEKVKQRLDPLIVLGGVPQKRHYQFYLCLTGQKKAHDQAWNSIE